MIAGRISVLIERGEVLRSDTVGRLLDVLENEDGPIPCVTKYSEALIQILTEEGFDKSGKRMGRPPVAPGRPFPPEGDDDMGVA